MIASSLENPWQNLPLASPYVLPEDDGIVLRVFNSSMAKARQIRLEVLPEPYLGRPDAPVVLLILRSWVQALGYQTTQRSFVRQAKSRQPAAPRVGLSVYLLNPKIERTRWWDRKLACLIEAFGGNGRSIVANAVL